MYEVYDVGNNTVTLQFIMSEGKLIFSSLQNLSCMKFMTLVIIL